MFKVLPRLALGLSTTYNSSSEVERDFRKQSQIFADPCRNKTSQLKLESKLQVMSVAGLQQKVCAKCISDEDERRAKVKRGEEVKKRKLQHCHCTLMEPDVELISQLRDKQPRRKYQYRLNQQQEEEKKKAPEREKRRELDRENAKLALKKEVARLKKKTQEEAVKKTKLKAAEKVKAPEKAKEKPKKVVSVKKIEAMKKQKRLEFTKERV